MTEKEKCQNGYLYNANFDNELFLDRKKAFNLCQKFNNSSIENLDNNSIKKLLNIGNNFFITPPFHCDYGYNTKIGDNFYSNYNLIILDGAKVTIGNNVFIAPNCVISTALHPLDYIDRNEGLELALPITIGNNVWIGLNVSILPGVKIGDGAVIGAGSVVTKDIPENFIAYGNPARPIRLINEKDKFKYPRYEEN